MRDDILYGRGFLDDGWNDLRDRLKTQSDAYKLYYTEDKLPNEYVAWSSNGTRDISAKTRRLFRSPFDLAINPALFSYHVVETQIPKDYVNGDVPSQAISIGHDTFLTHMSRRYANMYCRLSTFNTAARLVYNLFATLSPVDSTFRSHVEAFVGDDVPDTEQTFMESKEDRTVRVVMSFLFHCALCLTHIAILSSGFMYRAVAIIRGHSHVNIIQDELVVQLVKLYAADMMYWQDMARKGIEMMFPIAGNAIAMLLFDGFWKNQMSMWTAHLWVALTPPMTRVVETIQKSTLPDKQLARELETDPYWSLIPIGKAYDDMIGCRATQEVAHGITNVNASSVGQHGSSDTCDGTCDT